MKNIETALLQVKDTSIHFRAPSIVRQGVEELAQRYGVSCSRLSLFVLIQFINMDVPMQKRLLAGKLKAGTVQGKIVEGSRARDRESSK